LSLAFQGEACARWLHDAEDADAELRDELPLAPFIPNGSLTLKLADLLDSTQMEATLVGTATDVVGAMPAQQIPAAAPLKAADTHACFKAAAAALAASRKAAAAGAANASNHRTPRRGGVSGVGGVLKRLRADAAKAAPATSGDEDEDLE
jgi:hypothetical protein